MVTPESGVWSRCLTLPRMTAARFASMVPGATPVWIGFGPVYKNSVAPASNVATPGGIGGAMEAGSGGNPPVWIVCNRKKRVIPVISTRTENCPFNSVGFCGNGRQTLVGVRVSVSSNTMLPGVFVHERRTWEPVLKSISRAGGDCAKLVKAPQARTTAQRRSSLFIGNLRKLLLIIGTRFIKARAG